MYYFAWADADEPFGIEHEVEEEIFSFSFIHAEGDHATLSITIRNPRIGLLAPGRKVWAWFSYTDGSTTNPIFYGRLVGIPSDIFAEVVTLEFLARPIDFATQKADLAEDLRVLPYFDPAFFAPEDRENEDNALEARSANWHIDPVTHELSISDIIVGEDGLKEYSDGEVLYDSLRVNLGETPLRRIQIKANIFWTQWATGTINLTNYVLNRFPDEEGIAGGGGSIIKSYSVQGLPNGWPKPDASIGAGWEVAANTYCLPLYQFEKKTIQSNLQVPETKALNEGTTARITTTQTFNRTTMFLPDGSIQTGTHLYLESRKEDWDEETNQPTGTSGSWESMNLAVPLGYFQPALNVRFDPDRKQFESISILMSADMQSIVTEPGDEDILTLDDFNTIDLSEGDDSIIDARERTYITTERGLQSIEYLLMVGRAHLLAKARAVRVDFEVTTMDLWLDATLKKNASIEDGRLPGGAALGKIVQRSLSLERGRHRYSVAIACAIGKGGTIVAEDGTPTWVEEGYVDNSYQEFDGRLISLGDVGYTAPLANPQDDGFNLHAGIDPSQAVIQFQVVAPPASQAGAIGAIISSALPALGRPTKAKFEKLEKDINEFLGEAQTELIIKLRPLNGEWLSPYSVDAVPIKVPKQIDLEAPSVP